jgi:hypothetical protein
MVRMASVVLEFVPPDARDGTERARSEAQHALELMKSSGLAGRIDALLVPGLIHEDSDRPVPLAEKLDPLDVVRAVGGILPFSCIVTQVTAFESEAALGRRLGDLKAAGVGHVVFVGVPRTLQDGQGPGLSPSTALGRFRDQVPHRGVILIPSRDEEKQRFEAKLAAGANFALSQMLFSDCIVRLVPELRCPGALPRLLLSFAYVPGLETRLGLIRWLIRDVSPQAQREMAWIAELAEQPFRIKKAGLLELYRRIVGNLATSGYPLSIHFECPYGFNPYAFEVFHSMLDWWAPPSE